MAGTKKKRGGSKVKDSQGHSKPSNQAVTEPASCNQSVLPSSSDASCSNSNYLTLAEIYKLKDDEKLVLEMHPFLNKHVNIYATAAVVRQVVGSARVSAESKVLEAMNTVLDANNHRLAKSCAKKDSEKLYRDMNTGQEGGLLEWQRYSMQCLNLAAAQHNKHNKPLPIRLDDDDVSLPPAMRAAHDRARLKSIQPEMWDLDTDAKGLKKGHEIARLSRQALPTRPCQVSPDELGPDDDFMLDVSKLMPPNSVHVMTTRTVVLNLLNPVLRKRASCPPADLMFRQWHSRLRRQCIDANSGKIRKSTYFEQDCIMLAVLERLLYRTPFCIRSLQENERTKLADDDGRTSVPLPDPKPTPSPLGCRNGYELRCRLIKGGPEHVVHLPLDTFKKDETVVLDMSELLGWPALLPIDSGVIMSLVASEGANVSGDSTANLEKQVQRWIKKASSVSPSIVDHMRAGCEKATQQFQELASTCAIIVSKQQVLYNQPIKLSCFPGIEEAADYYKDIHSFAKRMRQECMKVLRSKSH